MGLFDGFGDEVWTLNQAAYFLNYPADFVEQRANDGFIPAIEVCDELLFSKVELERWVLGLRPRKR
jgi:hypothetical protein